MDMATGEILSFSIHHRPDLDFVMESLKGVLPILKQANTERPSIPIKDGNINIRNGLKP